MATVTLTLTAADATRVTNAATALGYPDGKTMAIALVKNAVQQAEQFTSGQAFTQTYTPIVPT